MARMTCLTCILLLGSLLTLTGCGDGTSPPPDKTDSTPAAPDSPPAPADPSADAGKPDKPVAPQPDPTVKTDPAASPPVEVTPAALADASSNPASASPDSGTVASPAVPTPPPPGRPLDRPAARVEVQPPADFNPDPEAGGIDQAEKNPPEELRDRIIAAYENLQTYEAKITFSIVQKAGRWDQLQRGMVYVAFDRQGGRFLLDKPDLRLVIDDDKLLLKSYKIEGRHLEVDAPDDLQYRDVQFEVPHFAQPHMPDVTFLLSGNPVGQMVNHMEQELFALPPHEKDEQQRPGLMVRNFMGTWTFRVDPRTHLITSAVYAGPEDGTKEFPVQRWHEFEIEIVKINQALAKGTFDIPLADSQAVATIRELVQGGSFGPPPGPGDNDNTPGRLGEGNHPMAGTDSPELALKSLAGEDFNLEDAGDDFVVLIFWSSWDGKSEQGLNEIQSLHQWAADNKKPVKVHAINVREEEKVVRDFIKAAKLTIPVYLDGEGKAAEAFDVTGLPQVMVIKSQRVHYANRGVVPDMAKRLRELIDARLGVEPEIPGGLGID